MNHFGSSGYGFDLTGFMSSALDVWGFLPLRCNAVVQGFPRSGSTAFAYNLMAIGPEFRWKSARVINGVDGGDDNVVLCADDGVFRCFWLMVTMKTVVMLLSAEFVS